MTQIETWLKTDLQQVVRVQTLDGNLFTADNGANRIGVIVTKGGKPVDVTGNIWGYLIMPDEGTLVIEGDSSENKAWVDLPKSAYTKTGPFSLVIKDGETTIGGCTGYIYRSTTDEIIDPGHVVPDIADLLAEIGNMRSATAAATEAATNANTKAGLANDAAANANTKAGLANEAATNANTKAGLANEAAATANAAAVKIDNMTVAPSALPSGSNPTVTISEVDGHKHIVFGMVKGDPGKDFRIKKTFASIAAMQAYDPAQDPSAQKMQENDFAMIDTGSVEDPDTGKLFCYEPTTQEVWRYIGDLSGAQGIKGEDGTGIASARLNADYTLTLTFTDGTTFTTTSIRGAKGDPGEVTEAELNAVKNAIIIHGTVENVPVATIHNGAPTSLSALQIAIDPVQDLHGQDSPYPAGGGKNLIDADTVWADFLQSDGTFYHPLGTVHWNIPASLVGVQLTISAYAKADANNANLRVCANIGGVNNNGTLIKDTTGFSLTQLTFVATSTDDFVSLQNSGINGVYKEIQLEKGSSATAYGPYENICPITGWTGCEVDVAGANLISLDDLISASQGAIGSYLFKHKLYLQLEPNTDYTLMTTYNGSNNVLYFNGYTANDTVKASSPKTRTSNSSGQLIVGLYDRSGVEEFENETVIVVLCKATEKEFYPISWETEAGTVYGGTLDPVNGVLTVDRVQVTFNGNQDENWGDNGANGFYKPLPDEYRVAQTVVANYMKGLSEGSGSGLNTWECRVGTSLSTFLVKPNGTEIDTLSKWVSYLSNNNLDVLFKLATPITYQLDPVEIETLRGINNLWADTGDILLMEYGRDTRTYIDEKNDGLESKIQQKAPIITDIVSNVPIATITDGADAPVSGLQIAVEPIQAGSGDPYPAGGSPQIWDEEWESGTLNNDGGNVTNDTRIRSTNYIPVEPETSYYFKCSATLGLRWYDANKSCISSANTSVNNKTATSPEGAYYLRFTVVDTTTYSNDISINYPSTDHDYHKWANDRPITGWTGCEVDVAPVIDIGALESYGLDDQGAVNTYSYYWHTDYIDVRNAEKVKIAFDAVDSGWTYRACAYNASKQFTELLDKQTHTTGKSYSYTYDSTDLDGVVYLRFSFIKNGNNPTVTDFAVINGVYPISWETEAGTVYGGTLTVNADGTGELKVTQALQTKTGSHVQQVGQSSSGVWWALLGSFDYQTEATSSQTMSRQKSNMYVPSANASTDCTFRIFGGTVDVLYAYNNQLDTQAKAEAFYNANPLQIWYPLATPIVIPLSNLPSIKTLLGNNNMWADCGDIMLLEYGCDTKKYVEKRLSASQILMELIITANRESEMKASKAYSSGDLLIVNNTMYKVSASIANGATLTVGTNVTTTTVAAELAALA